MPPFIIKINPGWEKEVRKVSLPNAGRRIVQRAFQLSFDKAWKTLIDTELTNTEFFEDLESGVISAIFGFTPYMEDKQIEEFKNLFRMKKSKIVLVGKDVISEITIKDSDIRKLKVRHRIRGGGGAGFVDFKWLEIIIKGMTEDTIQAKIMTNIEAEISKYVEEDSIYSKSLPSGLQERSRSGKALMQVPEKSPRVAKLLKRGFTKKAAEVSGTFEFHIVPYPFLLDDILAPVRARLRAMVASDFQQRINKIPPMEI